MIILDVVEQHAELLIALASQRLFLITEPNISLNSILRMDNRLLANIDGLLISNEAGWKYCLSQLNDAGMGEYFAVFIFAIKSANPRYISHALSILETHKVAQTSLIEACAWVGKSSLVSGMERLFEPGSPHKYSSFIAYSVSNGLDIGSMLVDAIGNQRIFVKSLALKAAAELGRQDLIPDCESLSTHDNPEIRFWASWSAALLGSQNTLRPLGEFALQPGPFQHRALNLLLKVIPTPSAHNFIQALSNNPANQRAVIKAVGIAGDPFYIPWLIEQMNDLQFTRLAGESFSFITGIDLAYQDLERKPPEDFESGPTDDPNDPNVELDEDDNLPWPDVQKVTHWWWQNSIQFQQGTRYFMGKTISGEHCLDVLKNGFQRQRMAAAIYLCLLNPGSVLFPTSAPAWRQKKLLEDWPADRPRKPERLEI